MARGRRARTGFGAAFLALTFGVFVVLAAAPGTTAALAACPHAGAKPHQTSLANLRKAMRCLVNHKRAQRGKSRLKNNADLTRTAQRHTKVMLREDCFRHQCKGEPGLNRRMKQSGYLKGANKYFYAEDLGFDHTPRRMMKRLMHSKYNRRNILNGDFENIGVGAGWGAPKKAKDDSKFETYTILFAWRRS